MNKNQQKHFLGMLTAWKEALIEEQEKTEQLIQQDQVIFQILWIVLQKKEEFMLELRKRERERKLIAKIDLSLKDLEEKISMVIVNPVVLKVVSKDWKPDPLRPNASIAKP